MNKTIAELNCMNDRVSRIIQAIVKKDENQAKIEIINFYKEAEEAMALGKPEKVPAENRAEFVRARKTIARTFDRLSAVVVEFMGVEEAEKFNKIADVARKGS